MFANTGKSGNKSKLWYIVTLLKKLFCTYYIVHPCNQDHYRSVFISCTNILLQILGFSQDLGVAKTKLYYVLKVLYIWKFSHPSLLVKEDLYSSLTRLSFPGVLPKAWWSHFLFLLFESSQIWCSRITEWARLEETPGGHLIQPPCSCTGSGLKGLLWFPHRQPPMLSAFLLFLVSVRQEEEGKLQSLPFVHRKFQCMQELHLLRQCVHLLT